MRLSEIIRIFRQIFSGGNMPSAVKIIPKIDLDKIEFDESPNYSERNRKINCIILHHTGPGSFNGLVSWLKNPQAQVSAHYVIGKKEDEIKQLVELEKKAWHAGKSVAVINGQRISNLNRNSIGVEIQNIGIIEKGSDNKFYYEVGRRLKEYRGQVRGGQILYPNGTVTEGYYAPYPENQIQKVIALCRALVDKYPAIKKDNIFSHFWVGRPIGRKNDPFGLDIGHIKDEVF
jgi:N-acetyl-anhydromuramyl-L-alanine amidase AmpD